MLSMTDFLVTNQIVLRLGNGGELNPFLRSAIDIFGTNFIIYFKLAGLMLMAGCIYIIRSSRTYRFARISLTAMIWVMVAIVGYGFFCLSTLKVIQ